MIANPQQTEPPDNVSKRILDFVVMYVPRPLRAAAAVELMSIASEAMEEGGKIAYEALKEAVST